MPLDAAGQGAAKILYAEPVERRTGRPDRGRREDRRAGRCSSVDAPDRGGVPGLGRRRRDRPGADRAGRLRPGGVRRHAARNQRQPRLLTRQHAADHSLAERVQLPHAGDGRVDPPLAVRVPPGEQRRQPPRAAGSDVLAPAESLDGRPRPADDHAGRRRRAARRSGRTRRRVQPRRRDRPAGPVLGPAGQRRRPSSRRPTTARSSASRFPADAAGRHLVFDTIDENGAFRTTGPR